MTGWKRNLFFIWLSQFVSIMGFTFAMPFAPFYIQELGVTDPLKLKVWVAVFAAAAPLSLAVCAPIWGWVADRFGRRIMLLRANLGAAVFLILMGSVHSVQQLILVRCLQGILTGTMTAAQAMVASETPAEHNGFALGTLSSGVFSGAMAGAFLGGIIADEFGCRAAFFAASGIVLLAGLFVLFGTTEHFVPPPTRAERLRQGKPTGLAVLMPVLPLLLLVGFISFVRRFDGPFLPLLVQDIHGSVDGAARWTGALFAVTSLAGFLAGIFFGRLADRTRPERLGSVSACTAGIMMLPQALAHGFYPLFLERFAMAFCAGGLEPVFLAFLAKRTARDERGYIFGWAATVRALGWMSGPIVSGIVASGFGIRPVVATGAGLFIVLAVVIHVVGRKALLHGGAPGQRT